MSGLLGNLSHEELLRLRAATKDPARQAELAPMEHQAFAREQVQSNPLSALGLLGAIPAYQLAKLLGLQEARTPPSMAQLLAGFKGIGQGLSGK